MPWTVSHVAAVLPLRRFAPWPLDFPALVIGSMTPDLGLHLGLFDLAAFAHTLKGSFLVDLPFGVLLLLAFYIFCKPLAYLLPRPHRPALLPICPDFDGLRPARWLIILLSLLIGIGTHNFWDAFTHDTGWFVERIAWLRDTVVHFGPHPLSLPVVLQLASTVIGAAIVAIAYYLWLRRQPADGSFSNQSDTWRYLLVLGICVLSLLIALPVAIHVAATKPIFFRAVIFRIAIYPPQIAVPLLLCAASVSYLRRPQAT